ncbi:hypothetical protein HPP92_004829 [Vanilla planifolia]|uniref:non-specific serine/threonine protein kinase n=1 Tax=Vanilla planifolia TaxID=51239 RepID=A0A835RK85_VANPL|nr:hypothetical protein HPP92_005194 [Vanilla planifolia]KAG0493835.1 hypothetical protein HPP92_004829 [Vanilla planifolia]
MGYPICENRIRWPSEGLRNWTQFKTGSYNLDRLHQLCFDYCDYPQVCGPYGVCSDGQCSCFGNASNGETNLFDSITWGQINSGCSLVNAISCQSTGKKSLLALGNLSYFNYIDETAAAIRQTNEASCKQACLANCSCKAALFKHENNVSLGDCYLPTELFSLKNTPSTEYSSSAYMKVQITQNPESLSRTKSSKAKIIILVTILGSLPFVSILVWFIIKKRGKNRTYPEIGGDDELDQVPGTLVRFSFDELQLITEGYKRKLGQGGFGSVFEGTLSNGIKVAVKKLEGVGQGKKEFLAEVETIGSIHHINLVDLVGFCAEKSHRLLVYEYMPKGSLDQWIFTKEEEEAAPLDWQTRRMIILDIAKGLCYLHEECRHRIVHLDVKPQNILLDEKLNAKLADFGLSKLIDREQSEVMTRMRGTPGYLAPEWLTSIITEKVDVYSFGVVVLEIICSRKNLDPSQPEEAVHLIALLDRLTPEVMIPDVLKNNGSEDGEDVLKVMKLAMWCLQSDSKKRPSMSTVVKVLEGSVDVEQDMGYDFFGIQYNSCTVDSSN